MLIIRDDSYDTFGELQAYHSATGGSIVRAKRGFEMGLKGERGNDVIRNIHNGLRKTAHGLNTVAQQSPRNFDDALNEYINFWNTYRHKFPDELMTRIFQHAETGYSGLKTKCPLISHPHIVVYSYKAAQQVIGDLMCFHGVTNVQIGDITSFEYTHRLSTNDRRSELVTIDKKSKNPHSFRELYMANVHLRYNGKTYVFGLLCRDSFNNFVKPFLDENFIIDAHECAREMLTYSVSKFVKTCREKVRGE